MISDFVVDLHTQIGEPIFLGGSFIIIVLGVWLIPKATDLATNSAAGLAGEILGPSQRTLVINSTTNLPELFLMLVSLFGLKRLGGIATPLGSNFANIYLMFLVAPVFVIIKWLFQQKKDKNQQLATLLYQERGLIGWHILMSITMFFFATLNYRIITGNFQFLVAPVTTQTSASTITIVNLLGSIVLCIVGISIFVYFEQKLKSRRPELYDTIDDEDFNPSWSQFLFGALSLIGLCYMINGLFDAWAEIFGQQLGGYALFPFLHYFIGSFMSSFPEITVAVENYERLESPDLNTALASASQSNMTNLVIAGLGSILAIVLLTNNLIYGL